jgi:hypothetical protein
MSGSHICRPPNPGPLKPTVRSLGSSIPTSFVFDRFLAKLGPEIRAAGPGERLGFYCGHVAVAS